MICFNINAEVIAPILERHRSHVKSSPNGLLFIKGYPNGILEIFSVENSFSDFILYDSCAFQNKDNSQEFTFTLDRQQLEKITKFIVTFYAKFHSSLILFTLLENNTIQIIYKDATLLITRSSTSMPFNVELTTKQLVLEIPNSILQNIKQIIGLLPQFSLVKEIDGVFVTKDGYLLITDTKTAIAIPTNTSFTTDFYLPYSAIRSSDLTNPKYSIFSTRSAILLQTSQANNNTNTLFIVNLPVDSNILLYNNIFPHNQLLDLIALATPSGMKTIASINISGLSDIATVANTGQIVVLLPIQDSNNKCMLSSYDTPQDNVSCASLIMRGDIELIEDCKIIFDLQSIKTITSLSEKYHCTNLQIYRMHNSGIVCILLSNTNNTFFVFTKNILLQKEINNDTWEH